MKFPAWLTAQVLSLAAIGVLAWLLVGQCNATSRAEAALAKSDEAATLDKERVQRAREADAKAMRAQSETLVRLEQELAALKIDSKPVFVASGSTGPVVVGGETEVGTPPPAPSVAQASPPVGPPPPAAGAPACVLYAGEHGEVRVTAAGAKTDAGNVVVSGEAEAWRLSPDARLFGGPLRLDVAVSPQAPNPTGIGWGIGAATVLTRSGWSVGPAVAAPTLNLWKLHLDATAGLTLGGGGQWAGTGTVIARWR